MFESFTTSTGFRPNPYSVAPRQRLRHMRNATPTLADGRSAINATPTLADGRSAITEPAPAPSWRARRASSSARASNAASAMSHLSAGGSICGSRRVSSRSNWSAEVSEALAAGPAVNCFQLRPRVRTRCDRARSHILPHSRPRDHHNAGFPSLTKAGPSTTCRGRELMDSISREWAVYGRMIMDEAAKDADRK